MTKLILSRIAVYKSIFFWECSWTEKDGWAAYNRRQRRPMVPAATTTASGVTIGIGYDCGHMTAAKIRADWGSVLSKPMVDALVSVAGLKGVPAANALPPVRAIVDVPIEAALQVFFNTSIYDSCRMALKIYPDLPKLHPVEIAVIVSLVYNRGNDINPNKDRRREMRQLIQAIKEDDDKKMADLILAMCRLWPNVEGLRRRRRAEAELIMLPDTPIPNSDKLEIIIP
jgi:hypothetical protein